MQRAVIGFDRWTEEFTLVGGNWQAQYPLSNLNFLPLTKVAKSNDLTAASCQFYGSSATIRPIRFLGICRHNFSDFGQFRLKLYSDANRSTLLYDSDWQDIWVPVYSSYDSNWYRPNFWRGIYSPLEKVGITPTRLIWLDQTYFCQSFEIFFRDDNNEDGFISLGMFEISEGYQVSYNPQYGATFGTRIRDTIVEAEGGVIYTDDKRAPRVFKGQIEYLPIDEAKQRFFEFQRRLKKGKPFLWMLDPDDSINGMRDGGLFRNNDTALIAYSAFGSANVPIDFEEIIG